MTVTEKRKIEALIARRIEIAREARLSKLRTDANDG